MPNTPNERVQWYAEMYARENRLPPIVTGHYVKVDQELAWHIACVYEALPQVVRDPDTIASYAALAYEVIEQWRYAINVMGMTLEPWAQAGQPYANSEEMCQDVRDNKHLWGFTGGEPHPFNLMSEKDSNGLTVNDKFRAVHDLFGHSAEGYQFGPRGEENAWIRHSMMFTSLAQRALTSETRGQNSWVNFGPCSHLPVTERPFAQQKAALLPVEYCDWKQAIARQG